MKLAKRLAVMAVAVISALSIPVGATASPSAPDGHARPLQANAIYNMSTGYGLGVIHIQDGAYTYGNYDAILPPQSWSDVQFMWITTAGWYTGPGYCTRQWRSTDGQTWTPQYPDLGPGQHFIGLSTYYRVEAYQGTC